MSSQPPHTTFALNLWRQVSHGRTTAREAVETFCISAKDLPQQIETMPDDMLDALEAYVSSQLNEGLEISGLEAHAHNFDPDTACKAKRQRLNQIQIAIRERRSR